MTKMRKLVVSEFISLDGVVEDPRWTFGFTGEDRERFKFEELAASDALLLGREPTRASRRLGPG